MTAKQLALRSFQTFLSQRLESEPEMELSPEEAVLLWREEQETIAAVRAGLADVAAGRTQPLDDYERDFRRRQMNQSAS